MTEDPTALRHEVKIVCTTEAAPNVETALLLHTAAPRTLHPPRTVQSVYFDSDRGRALLDNIAGISEREKLRFRWYGAEAAQVTGTLEKKIRRSNLGRKEFHRVDREIAVRGATARGFTDALRAASPPVWRAALDGLRPAQWIRYDRRYLVTFDRRVRITIDRDVRTVDLRVAPTLDPARTEPPADVVIFELKASASDDEAIVELLDCVRVIRSKCSKFVLASAPDEF